MMKKLKIFTTIFLTVFLSVMMISCKKEEKKYIEITDRTLAILATKCYNGYYSPLNIELKGELETWVNNIDEDTTYNGILTKRTYMYTLIGDIVVKYGEQTIYDSTNSNYIVVKKKEIEEFVILEENITKKIFWKI